MTRFSIVILALAACAFAQGSPTPTPLPTGGGTTTTQAPQLVTVVSDPQWVATSPLGQPFTISFRALLSNGLSVTDFRSLGLVFQGYTNDGATVAPDLVSCNLAIAQCVLRSNQPRTIYIYAALVSGGLGYASVAVNFFRQVPVYLQSMEVTSSQVQADDGTSQTLIATSPLTMPGPVFVNATSQFDNAAVPVSKSIYLPDGVVQGQRIVIYNQEVTPFNFQGRRYFQVQMMGANGQIVAQGFGSSVGSMELRQIDGVVSENGDLVFTLSGAYSPAIQYSIVLLRGNKFRVELSQARNEVFAYPSGNKVKVVFQRGSLAGNRFDLQAGSYTVSVNGFDTSNGLGFSNSRPDALNLDGSFILQ